MRSLRSDTFYFQDNNNNEKKQETFHRTYWHFYRIWTVFVSFVDNAWNK